MSDAENIVPRLRSLADSISSGQRDNDPKTAAKELAEEFIAFDELMIDGGRYPTSRWSGDGRTGEIVV